MENTTTDPDCGVFHKGEHKNVFAYTANVACDRHNYILGFEATAGNLHNSTVFPLLYGKLKSKYEGIKNVMVNTQWIIVLFMASRVRRYHLPEETKSYRNVLIGYLEGL